jgi:hypothetical protein
MVEGRRIRLRRLVEAGELADELQRGCADLMLAGGSKLNSVRMFRHMALSFARLVLR